MTQCEQLVALMTAIPRGCALDESEPVGDAYYAACARVDLIDQAHFDETLGALGILLEQWDSCFDDGYVTDAAAELTARSEVIRALNNF